MGDSRRRFLGATGGVLVGGLPAGLRRSVAADAADRIDQETTTASTDAVETVATNLEVPWGVDRAPDGTVYFTERPGRISRLASGSVDRLATLENTVEEEESGLLGLALHPDFPDTPAMYVYQTYQDGMTNRILRFRLADGGLERVGTVLGEMPGHHYHDGGRLAISPDRKLLATCGDATQEEKAQNPNTLHGTIIRLNLDGSVPSDNPFGNPVFTFGHRNPQGLSYHPESGELYSTEHGPDTGDEINLIRRGNNYGWPVITGIPTTTPSGANGTARQSPANGSAANESAPNATGTAGTTAGTEGREFTPPLVAYTPTVAPASAQFFDGSLYFGTLAGTHLHEVTFESDGRTVRSQRRLFDDEFGRIRSTFRGADALYFTTSNRDGRGTPAENDDRILRWTPGS